MAITSGKGQLGMEVMFVFVVLFIVGIGFVFVYPAFNDINEDLQADLEFNVEAKAAAEETVGNYPSTMDNVFFFLFTLLWIFMIGVSFFADTHPFFLVISIILIVFSLVAGMMLSNTYEDMKTDEDFSSFATGFPKINWILSNILIVGIMMSLSSGIILYGRTR